MTKTPSRTTTRKLAAAAASVLVVGGLAALAAPAFVTLADGAGAAVQGFGNLAAGTGELELEHPRQITLTETYDRKPITTVAVEDLARAVRDAAAYRSGCDEMNIARGYSGSPQATYPRPDRGPRDFAAVTVTYDEDGNVATYTVAPGDAGAAIGERFCIDYVSLFHVNGIHPIPRPGDVLVINP